MTQIIFKLWFKAIFAHTWKQLGHLQFVGGKNGDACLISNWKEKID